MTSFGLSVCKYSRSYCCIFHYSMAFCRNWLLCFYYFTAYGTMASLCLSCCRTGWSYCRIFHFYMNMLFCFIKFIFNSVNFQPSTNFFMKFLGNNRKPCGIVCRSGHDRKVVTRRLQVPSIFIILLHDNS